tara:strand:- start:7415 stop:7726 length:312 start_codon:yes stop_codon:yes gene_type:complete
MFKPQVIYLFSHNGNQYLGSTTDYKTRMFAHNQHYKQVKHNKCRLYQYMIANNITDIREYTTILKSTEDDDIVYNKLGLRCLEQEYIDELQPNLNMINAVKKP